jgi:hypothetical protein
VPAVDAVAVLCSQPETPESANVTLKEY